MIHIRYILKFLLHHLYSQIETIIFWLSLESMYKTDCINLQILQSIFLFPQNLYSCPKGIVLKLAKIFLPKKAYLIF